MVDIAALHDEELLQALLLGHGVTIGMLAFVAVHALQLHRHTVHQETAIHQLHIAETNLAGKSLRDFALVIFQRKQQTVQVGLFGAPQGRVGHKSLQRGLHLGTGGDVQREAAHGGHGLAAGVDELALHGGGAGSIAAVIHIHLDAQVAQAVILFAGSTLEIRVHKEVSNLHLGGGVHVHIAEDTGKAPHVLAFQVGTVAVAVYLCSNHVGTRLHVLGDVEHGSRAAVLGETYLVAIHPQVEEGIHAIETNEYLAAIPISRKLHIAAVAAHGVRLGLHAGVTLLVLVAGLGHHAGPVAHKGVALVAVDGGTVAAHLPVAGHINLCPAAHICFRLIEIQRTLIRAGNPVEFPVTIEREHQRGIIAVAFQCLISVGKRYIECTRFLAPLRKVLRILPVRMWFVYILTKSNSAGHC